MIKIKLIPAGYGMSILVSVGGVHPINILIDGGTSNSYSNGLKKEVDNIIALNEKINLVVCTHIDHDHISGLTKLLMDGYGTHIEKIWYNGFLQIIDEKYYNQVENKKTIDDTRLLNRFIQNSIILEDQHNIGIADALTFGALAIEQKIPINVETAGKAICVKNEHSIVKYKLGDVELIILGPTSECLRQQEIKWEREMIAKGFHFSVPDKIIHIKAFELMMERIIMNYSSESYSISSRNHFEKYYDDLLDFDSSITNQSSISFILKYNEKSILFLGDSVIDKSLLERIEKAVGKVFKFNAIQLPHHGSRYNITIDFIKRYIAEEYYILTDSTKFNHPDICVLADIALLNKERKTFVFNYPIVKANFICNKEWQEEYYYQIYVGNGKESVERIYI